MSTPIDELQPTRVHSRHGAYPIYIANGALKALRYFEPFVHGKRVIVISQAVIAEHYYPILKQTLLQSKCIDVALYLIPAGDSNKTLEQVTSIWDYCMENQYRRDTVMLALGGGMVGDLAGFAASCYLRGVDLIQCPTTLLGQIDSAIGGKTAINRPLGKNLIGSIYPPKAVICDLLALKTLPIRQFRSGLAELIKYSLILDEPLFNWLEQYIQTLHVNTRHLQYAMQRACQLKALVVSDDEHELGNRIILNFGHTVGHAIEALTAFELLHGEAVSIGMVIATNLACEVNGLSYTVLERLVALLKLVDLPITIPQKISVTQIMHKMMFDKKNYRSIHWVLLDSIGKACVNTDVSTRLLEKILLKWS